LIELASLKLDGGLTDMRSDPGHPGLLKALNPNDFQVFPSG
jgi:hypothetical protein